MSTIINRSINQNDLVRYWYEIIRETDFDKAGWVIDNNNIYGEGLFYEYFDTKDECIEELIILIKNLRHKYYYYNITYEVNPEKIVVRITPKTIVYRCVASTQTGHRCGLLLTVGKYCHIHRCLE
jgi:hypothetical protein